MNNPVKAYGRMELAHAYFPFLKPKSAWEKLRSVMLDDERLSPILTKQTPHVHAHRSVTNFRSARQSVSHPYSKVSKHVTGINR